MKIPYGRQFIDNRDILNVASALKKNLITIKLINFFKIMEISKKRIL